MISRTSMKNQMKGNKMKGNKMPIKKMKRGGKTTQKKLDKNAKYRASVAYQTKNAPKTKGMDYLKDLPGTLSKDMSQAKQIRKRASQVAAGDPIAEKKYGTGKRTGTNMNAYIPPSTDGSVEYRPKTTKLTKKKSGGVIKANVGKLLETFSPAYSVMKGKGPIANMLGMAKAKPMAGLTKEEKEAKAREQIMANRSGRSNRMTPMTGMMAGGPVKRKRSIDGCAMKGKTRAV